MADKKLSQLSAATSVATLWLSGYDLTRPVGDQNVKILASLLGGGAVMPTAGLFLLEDGSGGLLLEDGSGYLTQEQ